MRQALKDSLAASPVRESNGYARGSIILCVSCGRPLFRLDAGIGIGERAGDAASKLKPVLPRDLVTLVERPDVHAGLRAWIKSMTWAELMSYCELVPSPRAGDPCLCPQCGHVWVGARTAEASDTVDRAYTMELHVIPPDARAAPSHRTGRSAPYMK